MLLLVIFYLLLATGDGFITYRILSEWGLAIELNSLIQWFALKLNLALAIFLGIALPTTLFVALAYALHAPIILAFLVAARAGYMVKQIETHIVGL